YGIAVTGAATLNLSSSTVTKIRDEPLGGCQNGVGILAGRSANSTTGTLNATGVTVTDYQKGGIVFDNAGSGGSVTSSVVTGVGAVSNIGGMAVSFTGAAGNSTGTLTGNNIHGTGVAVQVIDDDLSDSFIPDVSGMSNQLAGNFYGIDNQTAKNLLFKKNWWGSATGPSDWSIGTGTGVSQNVRFFPWSTNAASTTFQVCTIVGTNSPDTLNGTAGNDIMCGKGADD